MAAASRSMRRMGNPVDDVEIIDVNDDGEEMPVTQVHKRYLENQDLGFMRQAAEDFLGEYGWYLLLLTIGVILLLQYLSKKRASQANNRSRNERAQDPALIVRRQEALEASRRRQQEELDAKAEEFKAKQKKVEEEKRKQKIEIWESMQEGKSYKAKVSSQGAEGDSSSSTGTKSKSDKKLRGAVFKEQPEAQATGLTADKGNGVTNPDLTKVTIPSLETEERLVAGDQGGEGRRLVDEVKGGWSARILLRSCDL